MNAGDRPFARGQLRMAKLFVLNTTLVCAMLWSTCAPAQITSGSGRTERFKCNGGSRVLLKDFVLSNSSNVLTDIIIQGRSIYTYDVATKKLTTILEGIQPDNIDFKDGLPDNASGAYTMVILDRETMRFVFRYEERTGRAEETWGVCKAS